MSNEARDLNRLAESDLPSFFSAADCASRSAQKTYLGIIATTIGLQIVGVTLGLVKPRGPEPVADFAVVSAVVFGLSLAASIILKVRKYDKIWYGARAAAESVKSMAWQYVTRGEPYSGSNSDELFVTNLKAVLAESRNLAYAIGPGLPNAQQITDQMREMRELPTVERLQVYLKERVQQQKRWYAGKAASNRSAEGVLFWLFVGAQLCAFGAALFRVKCPESLNLTGLFAALAATFLAWLQIRKHQELAQAYTIAAHELALIEAKAPAVKSDSDLSRFVGDAESAISREHTLWIARRDTV